MNKTIKVFLAQLIAISLVISSAGILRFILDINLGISLRVILYCVFVAFLGKVLKFEKRWFFINLAVAVVITLSLSSGFMLFVFSIIAFVMLLILLIDITDSFSSLLPQTKAANFFTSRKTITEMLGVLPDKDFVFIDLGSGLGGVPIAFAEKYKNSRFVGIEKSVPLYLFSMLRLMFAERNVSFKQGDFWYEDLSEYDCAYCFMQDIDTERLYKKVKTQMKKGSVFISNSVAMPDAEADRIVKIDDYKKTVIYILYN